MNLSMLRLSVAVISGLLFSGCASFNLKLFVDKSDPLHEFTLSGTDSKKVLIIHVDGFISNSDQISLLTENPGMVEHVVSQLKLAAEDDDIRAIVLKINSPGGLTTASDIIYNELMKFKKKTGKKVVVSMMDVAASGGYMIALPADLITAHPTTVTGSVGVIFMRPQVSGLMDKIGLSLDVTKSGKNKDMGSPFRLSTPEEEKLFQHVIDTLDARFLSLVQLHRHLTKEHLKEVASARIFIATDAQKLGLIDKICYLEDAISDAEKLAGIPKNSRVVVYRRKRYPNDNLYNTSVSHYGGSKVSLINSDILNLLGPAHTGFFALWPGAIGRE